MKKLLIGLGIVFLAIIILLVVVGIVGFFSANKLTPSVESFISDFYKQYNMQNISYIYNNMSTDKLKEATTYAHLEKLMKGVYQKLGIVKERKKGAWKIFSGLDGVLFSVQYSVTHERGVSTDSFTLKKHNDSWLLYYYNVNSNELF